MSDSTTERSPQRRHAADRRDGLLALAVSQIALLAVVAAAGGGVDGMLSLTALAAGAFVGLPAFLGALVLLAPDLE